MLFNTPILDVALGFIFIFSLLALLITQINTLIISLFRMRSYQLKRGVTQLILDPELRARLMSHPMIHLVSVPSRAEAGVIGAQSAADDEPATDEALDLWFASSLDDDMIERINNAPPSGVEYIAPETFVEVLTSILRNKGARDALTPLFRAIRALPVGDQRNELWVHYRRLQENFNAENLEALRRTIQAMPNNEPLIVAYDRIQLLLAQIGSQSYDLIGLLEGVKKIENESLRRSLEMVISTAKNVDDARDKLAKWFDNGMSRASSAFTTRIRSVTLGVSAVLVITLNVDTLQLGRALWSTPELRAAVVTAATAFDTGAITVPDPVASAEADPDATFEEVATEVLSNAAATLETLRTLSELNLPIWWEFEPVTPEQIARFAELGLPDPRTNSRNLANLFTFSEHWLALVLGKIAGWGLTIIAAAQGAPFWFDLLRRVSGR